MLGTLGDFQLAATLPLQSTPGNASHFLAGILAQTPAGVAFTPTAIVVLCVIAGIGTVLLLPGRREASFRVVGGAILIAVGLIGAALLLRWAGSWSSSGVGPYFWIFSAIALVGAVRVVTHSRPVYSALYFVLTVFATAGLFLLLYAEFMAVALVLIYAGAILVTYVFVIMLAAEAIAPGQKDSSGKVNLMGLAEHDAISREPLAASIVGFALMGMILFLIFDKAQAITPQAVPNSIAGPVVPVVSGGTQDLGAFLFHSQIVNLELAGLILTIAMVGAIVIARKRVIQTEAARASETSETIVGPSTPIDDNPHSIPVYGTVDARQKAYPQT